MYTDISDHFPVVLYLHANTKIPPNNTRKYSYNRIYRPDAVTAFNFHMSNTNYLDSVYEIIDEQRNPSHAYDCFVGIWVVLPKFLLLTFFFANFFCFILQPHKHFLK